MLAQTLDACPLGILVSSLKNTLLIFRQERPRLKRRIVRNFRHVPVHRKHDVGSISDSDKGASKQGLYSITFSARTILMLFQAVKGEERLYS